MTVNPTQEECSRMKETEGNFNLMAKLKPIQLSLIIFSLAPFEQKFHDDLMVALYSKYNSGVIPVKNVKSLSSKNCCSSFGLLPNTIYL